ncbi:MAG: NERD domain-containing protein [Oligoflexales bacterium]|nr:NERD domain-containing protein [Oligoflexales bacterium]
MAKLFPDAKKSRVVFISKAEEQFYTLCEDRLSDDWSIYYSSTLSFLEYGEGLQDNEIDFVLYNKKYGVIVIEVKGGRIKFDAETGEFYSINQQGNVFNIKNPFKQVLNWKSRFLRYLKKQWIRVPVSHAVCFPSVLESDFPQTAEIEPALIIGVNKIQELEETLRTIVKDSQPERYLEFADVGKEIDKILRGSNFTAKIRIRDYIDSHEIRIRDVEGITDTLVSPISSAKRLCIEGEAGTGKTMLAIMLARYFRGDGRKVLFLFSSYLMSSYLKDEIGSGVEVKTYEEIAASYGIDLIKKPHSAEGSNDDWVQFTGPEKLKVAISASFNLYEVVICDEAQDVQPFWWEAFVSLLRYSEESRLYIFFDRSQGVFGSGGKQDKFVPEDVLPVNPPYFPLVHNYRTTREIATFSRNFRTGIEILRSHCGRLGYKPEIVSYQDAEDFKEKLVLLFKRLFEEEGLESDEVTLLSARIPFAEGSVLNGVDGVGKYKFFDLGAGKKKSYPSKSIIKGKVPVSTIASFKGLETSVGIIINLSEYNMPITNPIMSSLVYVASTRAKHMLYLMVQKDDPKKAAFESSTANIQQTGAILVEGSRADHEYSGFVSFYNPDRFGWIKVSDPSFEKGSVIFFPYDVVKSEISQMKAGMKLKFRPFIEGGMTVAIDLEELSSN